MATRKELQQDIDQMQDVYNDASTPAEVKATLKEAIDKAKAQLAKLPEEKEKPASVPGKKKAEKEKKPAKKAAAKKAISLADCKEIVAKYTQSKKTEKKRIEKRKKQGKPAKLTVPETIKKAAKSVKSKVADKEDKGKKITRAEQDAAINQIVGIAGAVLDGMQPQEYTGFIDRLVKAIRDHLTKPKKAAEGAALGGDDDLPMIGGGTTQSGNMRIGSHRTENFDISPEAQKLFDELLKEAEGNTHAYILVSTSANNLDAVLAIVKEVQMAGRCTRLEYTNAISNAMLFMYWFGKLLDRLPGDANINRFYPRFLPGYLYFLASKLPEDASPEMAAWGKRLKSAIMRDRAYQSDEPWEQDYQRAGSPKHPRYAAKGLKISEQEPITDQQGRTWYGEVNGYYMTKDKDKSLIATRLFFGPEPEEIGYVLYDDFGSDVGINKIKEFLKETAGWQIGKDYHLWEDTEKMARGGKLKINKDYKWFVFDMDRDKIVAGNAYREDANDVLNEAKGRNLKVYSAAHLKNKLQIDPYDSDNWSNLAFLGMTLINAPDNTLIANSQAGVI